MKKLFFFALLILGAAACKQANKEELQQAKEQIAYDETSKALDERFGDIFETVPISELGPMLEAMDALYDESFINDPGKAGEYIDIPSQAAANLGVYYMDIHYAAAYDKQDKVAAIYNAMQILADTLGVGRTLNQAILEDFSENLEQNPEAKKIIENALIEAGKNLNTSNRPRIATIIMAGLVVERLYLMASIIDQSKEKEGLTDDQANLMITPMVKALALQKNNVDRIVEALNLVRQPEDEGEIFPLFYELQNEYAKLDEVKNEIDRTEVVDPSVLGTLYDVIADIREKAVTPGVQ
jgi:hypothetical protein